MKRLVFAAVLLGLSAQASAYLSQDGTRLANGGGRCAVCKTGWILDPKTGGYTCDGEVTIAEPDCRPAAALVDGPKPIRPGMRDLNVYSVDGVVVRKVKVAVPRQ